MEEFFTSTFFFVLLAQSTFFIAEKSIGDAMEKRNPCSVPFFYQSPIYTLYTLGIVLIQIVSVILCGFKFSWWLLAILPALDYILPVMLAAVIFNVAVKCGALDKWRFALLIITAILSFVVFVMWFFI